MIVFTTLSTDAWAHDALVSQWTTEAERGAALNRTDARAREFLLSRVALRQLLNRETGHKDWRVEKKENGAPYILTDSGKRGPFISLSHTKGLVAAALSEAPVGIDVEQWRQRDFGAIMQFLNEQQVSDAAKPLDAPAFYRAWCTHEAIGKLSGRGIYNAYRPTKFLTVPHKPDGWIRFDSYDIFYKKFGAAHTLALARAASENDEMPSYINVEKSMVPGDGT